MISIEFPQVNDQDILEAFQDHAPELHKIKGQLEKQYAFYKLSNGNPLTVKPIAVDERQKDDLLNWYGYGYKRRVRDIYKSNWIYDLRHGRNLPYCPMCGNTGRDALDHYLPKEDYPEFAVFSPNLVPTCTACNGKRNRYANAPGVELSLLHPYIDGGRLNDPLISVAINGTVNVDGTISFAIPSFRVIPYVGQGDPIYTRLTNHIEKCLSIIHFERWIMGRWSIWRHKAPAFPTTQALRAAISDELAAEVAVGGTNNWTAAFLRGLAADAIALEWIRLNQATL